MINTPKKPSSSRRASIFSLCLACIAVVGGALCRVGGLSGELWLDEMWSVLNLQEIGNPVEILTRLHHDNNHPLNSLWLWVCGATASPELLRAPSVIFGVATVATLVRWGRLMNQRALGSLWALFVAFSYPFILADSEARGYSLCLLCAALCFYYLSAISKHEQVKSSAMWFGVWAALGCFTHATFALFLAPAMVWIFGNRNLSLTSDERAALIRYGALAPAVAGTALVLVFYSKLHIGGAPSLPYLEVAATTLSVAFGGPPLSASNPEASGQALFLAIFLIAVLTSELRPWLKTKDSLSSLVCLIVTFPILAVTIGQPHFILSRYFLIPLMFIYLLFARFLVRMAAQGIFGSLTAVAMMAGYLIGNSSHTIELTTSHRSHFLDIFSYIATQTTEAPVSVGGQQDFQNMLRLRYAQRVQPECGRITYEHNDDTARPRFFINETLDAFETLPESFEFPDGTPYTAIQRYKAPLLNGSRVTLYERKQ